MEEIGLMPSSTGQPGGKKTGQNMAHYVIEGAAFDRAFSMLSCEEKKNLKLQYLPNLKMSVTMGLGSNGDDGGEGENEGGNDDKPSKSGKKFKYTCECGNNVWGKTALRITCQECGSDFREVG